MSSTTDYLMGVTDAEFQRLKLQATYLEPVTRRMIEQAGIGAGMRVLDIGCGMGDVSLMLAEAVGPSGRVVAIDREERAIANARARFAEHTTIEFLQMSDEDIAADASFDAVIGRYVLFHQSDPIPMVRRAMGAARPGGVIAFHEMVTSVDAHAVPPLELFDRVARVGFDAARLALPFPDAGGRLVSLLTDAGLPGAQAFYECVGGGPDSLAIPWLLMSYHTMLPAIDKMGMKRADVGDLDTLKDRMVAEARAARTQFILNPQCCAWAVKP